jgi:hypothetical protein
VGGELRDCETPSLQACKSNSAFRRDFCCNRKPSAHGRRLQHSGSPTRHDYRCKRQERGAGSGNFVEGGIGQRRSSKEKFEGAYRDEVRPTARRVIGRRLYRLAQFRWACFNGSRVLKSRLGKKKGYSCCTALYSERVMRMAYGVQAFEI